MKQKLFIYWCQRSRHETRSMEHEAWNTKQKFHVSCYVFHVSCYVFRELVALLFEYGKIRVWIKNSNTNTRMHAPSFAKAMEGKNDANNNNANSTRMIYQSTITIRGIRIHSRIRIIIN